MTIHKEQILCQQLTRDAIVRLVGKANEFESYVLVEMHQKCINAKSILSMSMFGGKSGIMTLHASGKDSKEAVKVLKTIFTKC